MVNEESEDKYMMQITEKGILIYEKSHNIKRSDSISESAKMMTDEEWDSIKIKVGERGRMLETPHGIID